MLELVAALEAIAHDRYLVLSRELADEHARRVFAALTEAEREHLQRVAGMLECFV